MTNFVSSSKMFFDDIKKRLADPEPFFLSRIGGSDTDAVVDYLQLAKSDKSALRAHLRKHLPRVSLFNGFYDLVQPEQSYFDYINCLFKTYVRTTTCTLCNPQLLSLYFPDVLHEAFFVEDFENKEGFKRLMSAVERESPNATFYPYQFIERIVFGDDTLFRAFSDALDGQTILVVSPFAESIRANFVNRHQFFRRNYKYPDFHLELVNTPITYSGLPRAMYPHDNWFSTLAALKSDISGKTFDVALLSCGSYAIPLGEHIKTEIGKKAIYVGGVLQLFFGIMGRRYEGPFIADQINSKHFIYPLERERYLKFITIHEKMAKEAFGAYF
jgi:hypothetical protein